MRRFAEVGEMPPTRPRQSAAREVRVANRPGRALAAGSRRRELVHNWSTFGSFCAYGGILEWFGVPSKGKPKMKDMKKGA